MIRLLIGGHEAGPTTRPGARRTIEPQGGLPDWGAPPPAAAPPSLDDVGVRDDVTFGVEDHTPEPLERWRTRREPASLDSARSRRQDLHDARVHATLHHGL